MKWFAEHAWIGGQFSENVQIQAESGRFSAIAIGARPDPDAQRLPGVVLPGFANTHSHAFHRALRGRTHDARGSFWTWRERMYAIAGRLDPDQYLRLATATYAEMALAGITSVGEFHYLHHAPGGHRYAEPNAMAQALRAGAEAAGPRLSLLDTCYLSGGLTGRGLEPLDEVQRRFADIDVQAWAMRVGALRADEKTLIGSAIHSVRAVPRPALSAVASAFAGPLHVHLSEQPAENEACQQFYGLTPTELLAAEGVLAANLTAVHATHLTDSDISLLAAARTGICFCPTTERDLADGIGPASALSDAGSSLSLGSDQHAVIDMLEEARALEMNDRLATLRRGRFSLSQLVAALTLNGHRAIGWQDAGEIKVGARADLVAVRMDSVRTAGVGASGAIFAATAGDVDTVIVEGATVVKDGIHALGDVGALLEAAIEPLWTNL